ncbi:MAG TPA: hypothetical protein VI356_10450 [Myxococcales bacterium]
MQPDRQPVDPHETLYVSTRKRFVPVYNALPDGGKELVLYCGLHEISFDEPDLFPWAEKLVQQDSFMAGSATTWSPDPLEWPRVKGLLEALLEAGILDRNRPQLATAQLPLSQLHLDFLEAEEARPVVPAPRSWNPDPGAVLREIVGRDMEAGYLEAALPVHRLAHIAIDREGRQVGEMNTYPDMLRLKLPTEWKTCGYAGSRYHDDMPMNMTALRSMLAHWKPVLRATLLFREEFLRRYPQLPDGRWKLGEVHFVSSGILALVGLQVMRWRNPVRNGDLDPVLSSLFRVIDGVRMVTAHMLDLYERPMFHDTPIGPKDVTEAAEREDQYRSGRGVCAGPQSMIDELLETLMNGKPVEGSAGPLGPWAADIPQALDYGLRGIQVYAPVMTVWVRMGLAYARIREALLRAPGPIQGRLGRFREAVERDIERLLPGRNHTAEQRDFSEPFYRRMFHHAQLGIRGLAPHDRKDLAVELAPPPGLLGERARGALRDLFASAEEPAAAAANGELLQEIADHVLDYLRFERNALRTVTAVQREINLLLGRPQPSAPLTGSQLAIFHLLRRLTPNRGQYYLIDTVQETLGVAVENQQDATTVVHAGRSLVLH